MLQLTVGIFGLASVGVDHSEGETGLHRDHNEAPVGEVDEPFEVIDLNLRTLVARWQLLANEACYPSRHHRNE
jgi:hypothetical protein